MERYGRTHSDETTIEPVTDPVESRASGQSPPEVELLDDQYARSILVALSSGPKRGRDLIETLDASRPTVYRRLDRLTEAGFVRTTTTLDPQGHHCKAYRLVRDTLTITIEDGGFTVTATPDRTEPTCEL